MVELDYKGCLAEGFDVVKANLPTSIVFGLCSFVPILGLIALVNFLAGVKAARHDGKPIAISDLFNFENVVDKVVVPLGVAACLVLCLVPGALILFAPCIIADKPGTAFDRALQGALAFGMANPVPSVVLAVLCSILCGLAALCFVLPALVVVPTVHAAVFVAYEQSKSALEVAAATAGVPL